MHGTRTIIDDHRTSSDEIDLHRLKEDHDIVRIVGWATPLAEQAGELRGQCPLHEERSRSFVVDGASQTFRCEACGTGGDVIDLVRLLSDCSQNMACEWLMGSQRTCSPADQPAVRTAAGRRALAVGNARAIWRTARPIAGTPAEAHVRSLGLQPWVAGGIRFAMTPTAFDEHMGRAGPRRRALVAACQDVDGEVVGVHRTFFDRQGGRVAIAGANVGIGQLQGTTLRFGPEAATIVLCSELEEGLAVRQMLPSESVWTALSPGHLAETVLPRGARRVVLAGRGDRTDVDVLARARATFILKGLRVDVIRPPRDLATFVEAVAGTPAG